MTRVDLSIPGVLSRVKRIISDYMENSSLLHFCTFSTYSWDCLQAQIQTKNVTLHNEV
jgi:hypothetical protein